VMNNIKAVLEKKGKVFSHSLGFWLLVVAVPSSVVLIACLGASIERLPNNVLFYISDFLKHAKTGTVDPLVIGCVLIPLLNVICVVRCHYLDRREKCSGLEGRRIKLQPPKYNISDVVTSSAITKQSILAALAIGGLVLIDQEEKAGTFENVMGFAAATGLTFTVICTLVSIACYNQVLRFNWKQDTKKDLLHRGYWIETLGWYSLALSIACCISIFNKTLSILIGLAYGPLLLYYYFAAPNTESREKIRDAIGEILDSDFVVYSLNSMPPDKREDLIEDSGFDLDSSLLIQIKHRELSRQPFEIILHKSEAKNKTILQNAVKEKLRQSEYWKKALAADELS
jgi:hypothetical protein